MYHTCMYALKAWFTQCSTNTHRWIQLCFLHYYLIWRIT